MPKSFNKKVLTNEIDNTLYFILIERHQRYE